jgi:hypothetical protein
LANGFTQEDGGGRLPVGNDVDIHGCTIQQYIYENNTYSAIYMGTYVTQMLRKVADRSDISVFWRNPPVSG